MEDTLTITRLSKVSYNTATVQVQYGYDEGKQHVTITADRACLLHFPNAELGDVYVPFEADEAQTFELPPEPCRIDFDVYVKADKAGHGHPTPMSLSEPPIIRP